MDRKNAFKAGASAALLMSVILIFARAARLTTFNLEMILGSMLTQSISPSSWLFGLFLHVIAGGFFAMVYAAVFERLESRETVKEGLGLAYLHILVGGIIFMGLLPHIHPFLNGSAPVGLMRDPGPFAIHYGIPTAVLFAALHFLYGASVGRLYKNSRKFHARSVEKIEVTPFAPPRRNAA